MLRIVSWANSSFAAHLRWMHCNTTHFHFNFMNWFIQVYTEWYVSYTIERRDMLIPPYVTTKITNFRSPKTPLKPLHYYGWSASTFSSSLARIWNLGLNPNSGYSPYIGLSEAVLMHIHIEYRVLFHYLLTLSFWPRTSHSVRWSPKPKTVEGTEKGQDRIGVCYKCRQGIKSVFETSFWWIGVREIDGVLCR